MKLVSGVLSDESVVAFGSPIPSGATCVLVEFPDGLQYNPELLEARVSEWPRSSRIACEFHHRSWECDGTYEILETYAVGLCVYVLRGYANDVRLTSDFAYVRLQEKMTATALATWAARIGKWLANGRDVYAFCLDREDASELSRLATAHP